MITASVTPFLFRGVLSYAGVIWTPYLILGFGNI